MADAISISKRMMCNVLEAILYQLVATPSLIDHIAAKQDEDVKLRHIREKVLSKQGIIRSNLGASIDKRGILRINGRICVPIVDGLRQEVLRENHHSKLAVYPSVTKMY